MTEVFLNGADGRLEGRYHHSASPKSPAVLILHPHPVHGGTMNNKVVYNMYKTFASPVFKKRFSVLRINFRGVGKSAGKFDNGIGELADAACALDWLQMQNIDASSYWVAGFSFGAWIALQLIMRRPEVSNFVLVSPPANKYDFGFISPCMISGLIVQGTMDSVVKESSVSSLVEKMKKSNGIKTEYRVIDDADHFFRNKLDQMNEAIFEYIQSDNKDIDQYMQPEIIFTDDDFMDDDIDD